MKKLVMVAVLFFSLTAWVSADIYVKSKTHTDAFEMMGQSQPAKDEVSEQWIGDDKFAALTPGQSFIIDLKKNVMYMVNHENKTYVEATLPLDFSKLLPPEMAQMASSMMKMTVSVNPTGQTKQIGEWNCTGYEATITMMMMPLKMTVWASEDVPVDYAQFSKMFANVLKAQMQLDEAAIKEMMKIKGYWIASETSGEIMGAKMRTTTEVLEIAKKSPPASVYAVPAGYTKQDTLTMQDLRKK